MLNNLRRYNFYSDCGYVRNYESAHGDYVRWEDVQEILAKDEPEVLLRLQVEYRGGQIEQFSKFVKVELTKKSLLDICEQLKDAYFASDVQILSFSKLDA